MAIELAVSAFTVGFCSGMAVAAFIDKHFFAGIVILLLSFISLPFAIINLIGLLG